MVSKEMVALASKRSVIREIYEYGQQRQLIVGKENVYDFSLGNPSVPAPKEVNLCVKEILDQYSAVEVHGYTVAPGDPSVRETIAHSLNQRFQMDYKKEDIFMTTGAAASLNIVFRALTNPKDEFVTIAPFFPEYQCFVTAQGGTLKVVPADIDTFQINMEALENIITPNTKGIIINSPNNPCGVVYSKETLVELANLLKKKSQEYQHTIYLISDEPYREIVYQGVTVEYVPHIYKDTIVCYSYSKSLSLPGERIGYIAVTKEVEEYDDLMKAIASAARVLGYVNAPSLFQRVAARCCDMTGDISIYEKNRNLLYDGLTKMGYTCVKPGGAFYLFPRALEEDAVSFCEKAKKYDLLLVPGDSFGCPGHVRISYCVDTKTIENALPLFEKLAKEYGI